MSKSFPWFRLYASDFLSDRKIKRINKATGISLAEIRGAWVALLCLASESPERGSLLFDGSIPYDYDDLAEESGVTDMKFHTIFLHFQKMGMVDFVEESGVYYLQNWNDRQPKSDSTAAARAKRYRESKRETVTKPSRDSHMLESESYKEYKEKDIKKQEQVINDSSLAVVSRLFENNITTITPMIQESLIDMIDEYPQEWITEAIGISVNRSKRRLDYVVGILRNWKTNGKDGKKKRAEVSSDSYSSWNV